MSTHADRLNVKIHNAAEEFDKIDHTGRYEKFTKLPYFANLGVDHVEGYTQYETSSGKYYYLLSHLQKNHLNGKILIAPHPSGPWTAINTPGGWDHPGGIQTIGRYLVVPCEKDGNSVVTFYDLENLAQPGVISFYFEHLGGCVGITDFQYGGETRYLMIVGDSATYHPYISHPLPRKMEHLKFDPAGPAFKLKDILPDSKGKGDTLNCQGFGLVTDENNQVYLVALMSFGTSSTYGDYAYLIKLTISEDGKVDYDRDTIKKKWMKSVRHVGGVDGTHFRWGAGIRVSPRKDLIIMATSKNIIAGTYLDTNYWRK